MTNPIPLIRKTLAECAKDALGTPFLWVVGVEFGMAFENQCTTAILVTEMETMMPTMGDTQFIVSPYIDSDSATLFDTAMRPMKTVHLEREEQHV